MFSSCSKSPKCEPVGSSPVDLKVVVDGTGLLKTGDKKYKDGNMLWLKKQLSTVEKALKADPSYRTILVYVHGGLISPKTARKEAIAISEKINCENENRLKKNKIFPIFVNWDTGLLSSYCRHLVADDSGITFPKSKGRLILNLTATPLKIVGDIGTGVARAPINLMRANGRWLSQADWLSQRKSTLFPLKTTYRRTVSKEISSFEAQPRDGFKIEGASSEHFDFNVELGRDHISGINEKDFLNFVETPIKALLSPLGESIGPAAWDNMKKRADLMSFRIRTEASGTNEASTPGVMMLLLDGLSKICSQNKHLSLDLYGHSMGTIVLNRAIGNHHQLPGNHKLQIDKIIYMAAACSISDFAQTTGSYISSNKTPFYNLCLHPKQEVRETLFDDWGSPLVAGSLLTWIDEMFERPPSFQQRTLGSFQNAIIAKDLLPKGSNVHVKAFSAAFKAQKPFRRNSNPKGEPQKHGEFNDGAFWRPDFYEINLP